MSHSYINDLTLTLASLGADECVRRYASYFALKFAGRFST